MPPGARVIYERFAGYVPREGGVASGTAGPKIVNFDRVEWHVLPDPTTALGALQRGEIDWWWIPDSDLAPLLRRNAALRVQRIDSTGQVGTLRFNHLIPPFNNPAIRRAFLRCVRQTEFMTGVVGDDRSLWRDDLGFFMPGSPHATRAGMETLENAPRTDAQMREEMRRAGYNGERVVLLQPTDLANMRALAAVAADLMQRMGLNLDVQSMGWNALVQRRFRQEPVEAGGWSIFCTFWNGLDQFSPAGHAFLRGTGQPTGPGWPTSPRIEAARTAWLDSVDTTEQARHLDELQRAAYADVPYVPLGQVLHSTVHRADLVDMPGLVPALWGVRRG